MAEFKKNIKKLLPYDRLHYKEFLFSNIDPPTQWYGFSFQLYKEEKDISLSEFIESYHFWFKNVVLKLDNDSCWIVNHDKADKEWFPNQQDNLLALRTLFKLNSIPNNFKGALIFSTKELLKFSKDLLSYPYAVYDENDSYYTNLDISNIELPFIIKILDHLNIDLLSTDEEFLKRIVQDNSLSTFNVIKYRLSSI